MFSQIENAHILLFECEYIDEKVAARVKEWKMKTVERMIVKIVDADRKWDNAQEELTYMTKFLIRKISLFGVKDFIMCYQNHDRDFYRLSQLTFHMLSVGHIWIPQCTQLRELTVYIDTQKNLDLLVKSLL